MTKLQLKKRPQSIFLSKYSLERKALKLGDRLKGTPTLRLGTDSSGNNVLIRTWQRDPSVDDSDLRDIWRNETRQLHRLAGYPGVSNYIAELRSSSLDDQGYYLVLSVGQRLPLQHFKDSGRRPPRSVEERRLAWANLLRVAKGLEILHLQGLLHRNLNAWSILTSGGTEPDFQLTGFEWSMRIVAHDSSAKEKRPRLAGEHSFTSDWAQFGAIARDLFEISPSRISDRSIPSHDVLEPISAEEIKLIRELMQIFALDRVDGAVVADRIDKILLNLSSSARAESPAFFLILPFGAGSPLAAPIREASERTIEINDAEAQEEFVRADLSSPTAMLVKQGELTRLTLRGERLTYRLTDYQRPGPERRATNWDYAYCDRIESQAPTHATIVSQVSLAQGAAHIMSAQRARQQNALRGRTTSWSFLRTQLAPTDNTPPAHSLLRKSLLLAQLIDYLLAAADTFPVDVRRLSSNGNVDVDGQVRIEVRPRADDERSRLSLALGIRAPDARLRELLNDDRFFKWKLTDLATIGDRSDNSTEWQYDRSTKEHHYVFSGERAHVHSKELFLVPLDSDGRDQQLRRRMKSFESLAEHAELSDMLVDPRLRVHPSHDSPIDDEGFLKLDLSKRHAFTDAVGTLPLFMVQGPPGVGKTRLVRELVRQSLEQEPASRLLLSAQSNHAVDHLLHEIEDVLSSEECVDSLVVRCLPKEKRDFDSRFDVSNQARSLLSNLLKSDLFIASSKNLQTRLTQLAGAFVFERNSNGAQLDTARKALERLVLHSANLVFATTNSSDLERLLDERSQFDWALVEEAGKATGGELISPLLLSPRRLMIGDHKQLPPFGADRVLDLLGSPSRVREAMRLGDPMIGWQLRDPAMDEILAGNEEDPATTEFDFPTLCDEASKNFLLFETLVEDEFERIKRGGKGLRIAARLDRQHRMHPTIARLVSNAFYDSHLFTDEEATERFLNNPSPVSTRDGARLPDRPVVWIDMPWTQDTLSFTKGERLPRYINDLEVEAALRVLQLLKAASSNKPPSLAVLSPYSRQVLAIARKIESNATTTLDNLAEFRSSIKGSVFAHTVDSFQGNEADCVVVSLVRNNAHGTIGRALGFLANANRMNVLFSRAKHRLVVIGSLSFLKSVLALPKNADDEQEIAFLRRVLEFVYDPTSCAIVDYRTLESNE